MPALKEVIRPATTTRPTEAQQLHQKYVQAEQAANKYRMEALRQKAEAERQRLRGDMIAHVYEAKERYERDVREQTQIRQLRRDAYAMQLCYNADMLVLRHTLLQNMTAEQRRRRPLITR